MAEITLDIMDSCLGVTESKKSEEEILIETLLETLKKLEVNDNVNNVGE